MCPRRAADSRRRERKQHRPMPERNTTDFLLATGRPDEIAVVDAGRSHSYAALRSAVATLAGDLASLDLPRGSRVGVLGPNSFFWTAAYLAAMKSGHVAVPFADKATEQEVHRNLEVVGCSAAFVDRRRVHELSGVL